MWTSARAEPLLGRLIREPTCHAPMIHQKVSFIASPCELFTIYLGSQKYGTAIDDRVSISRKVGARFTAGSGMLRGRHLGLARRS